MPFPPYGGIESKSIDRTGVVTITRRYLQNDRLMQDRIFRPVTVEDMEEFDYGPDFFYEGCGPGLYRKANCREATDSDEAENEDAGGDPEDVPLEVTLPPPRSATTQAEELYWAGGATATATTAATSEASDSGDLLLDMAGALSGFESEEDRPQVAPETDDEEPQGVKSEEMEEKPSRPAVSPTGPTRQQRRNRKRRERHRAAKRRRKQAQEPEYLVLDSVEASDDEASPPKGNVAPSSPRAEGDGFYCPVCRRRVSVRARRHIEVNHLPWWIAPDRACWSCRRWEPSLGLLQARHDESCQTSLTEERATTWVHLCNGLLRMIHRDLHCRSDAELLSLVAKGPITLQPLLGPASPPQDVGVAQRLGGHSLGGPDRPATLCGLLPAPP